MTSRGIWSMPKKQRRKIGKKRRPLHETEEFQARQKRSVAEHAQVTTQPLAGGGMISGPIPIIDLLQSHGEEMIKDKS